MPNTRFYSLSKYLQEQLEKEPSAFPWRLIEDDQRGELLLQFFIANPAGEYRTAPVTFEDHFGQYYNDLDYYALSFSFSKHARKNDSQSNHIVIPANQAPNAFEKSYIDACLQLIHQLVNETAHQLRGLEVNVRQQMTIHWSDKALATIIDNLKVANRYDASLLSF
ncbi:hypothetical protein ACX4ZB_05805 [Aerococcus urinae]